jgi:AcrR family transcriptional regulator
MSSDTKQHLLETAQKVFARSGYDGLSMRTLAKEAGIATSVTYHYFKDKDVLLKALFDAINTNLGVARKKLPSTNNTLDALRQRIDFQFTHAEEVVCVLKYFLHYRNTFEAVNDGYVPAKAYLHIEEILEEGLARGELDPTLDIADQAKIITHAINGFVLEYFPDPPTGKVRTKLVSDIATFVYRSIERRSVA